MKDGSRFCPCCGAPTEEAHSMKQQQPQQYQAQPQYQTPPVEDSGSIGWFFLGFIIPIAGVILFAVWYNEKPKCAKMSGIGALVGVIVGIGLYVLIIMLAIGIGITEGNKDFLFALAGI